MSAAATRLGATVLRALQRPDALLRPGMLGDRVRGGAPPHWWVAVPAALPPLIMVAAWLTAAALQPPGYDPVRQTISVLAGHAATDAWIVTSTLYVVSGCLVLTALGLRELAAVPRLALLVAAAAGAGIGANPQPAQGASPQHIAWTALGSLVIALWPALLIRHRPVRTARATRQGRRGRPGRPAHPARAGHRWPTPVPLRPRTCAAVTAVYLALLVWFVLETQGGGDLGLAERLGSTAQLCWPGVVAVTLRATGRRVRPAPAAGPA